jgi:hypothetical protein
VRQVAGDLGQVQVGLGGEGGVEALLEFLDRQTSVREVLTQARGGRLPVRVADPNA